MDALVILILVCFVLAIVAVEFATAWYRQRQQTTYWINEAKIWQDRYFQGGEQYRHLLSEYIDLKNKDDEDDGEWWKKGKKKD